MAVEGSEEVADMRGTVTPVGMPGGKGKDDEARSGIAVRGYRPLW
jgi:hypothetical protein